MGQAWVLFSLVSPDYNKKDFELYLILILFYIYYIIIIIFNKINLSKDNFLFYL